MPAKILLPHLLLAVLACAAQLGCWARPQVPPPEPVAVTVSLSLQREVTDFAVFTGRTEAQERVEVRARVGGFLDEIKFKDGALVKENDLLFVIDQRPFK